MCMNAASTPYDPVRAGHKLLIVLVGYSVLARRPAGHVARR
jgi:hypothetical protein